jgi:hypothetical protein
MRDYRERGVTLSERIISRVVIGIAASAVLGVLSSCAARCADAQVLSLGVSFAEASRAEITL